MSDRKAPLQGGKQMVNAMTTNDVRRKLEDMGAKRPGRAAVQMIAHRLGSDGQTHYWEICLPEEVIKSAVDACAGKQGEDSYQTFMTVCKSELNSK